MVTIFSISLENARRAGFPDGPKRRSPTSTARKHRRIAASKRHKTPNAARTILLVDDDESTLAALGRLVKTMGFKARMYSAPSDLLKDEIPSANACLVLDINLPEMSGAVLYKLLMDSGRRLPTVYITGDAGNEVAKILQRPDAPELLFKPIRVEALLEAIERAFTSPAFSLTPPP